MNDEGDEKGGKRRYNYMESVLQNVITKISLNDNDKKRNNLILNEALEIIIQKMKETSPVFSKLYQNYFYGGSYYDNLKVDKPDEYDIDLLLVLTKKKNVFSLKPITEAPGFVTLQYTDENGDINGISELFDKSMLCTAKVLKWMESTITKAMHELPKSGTQSIMKLQGNDFYFNLSKSGPAFTMKLNGEVDGANVKFDVDLVPCFIFGPQLWPSHKFRANPVKERPDFFIVPKQPKLQNASCRLSYCWRLSFQEQERQLIRGKRTLKPCIKLVKKLRDRLQQASISSYFIKTMFLWELEKQDTVFWENSLSFVFIEMLSIYEQRLRNKEIPYYWNRNNNLIANLSSTMLENYANKLRRIVTDLKRKTDEPWHVATYYLGGVELEQIKGEHAVSPPKLQENASSNTLSKAAKCTCKNESTGDIEIAMSKLRNEIDAMRCEQEVLKKIIMEGLGTVLKRLDDLENKIAN